MAWTFQHPTFPPTEWIKFAELSLALTWWVAYPAVFSFAAMPFTQRLIRIALQHWLLNINIQTGHISGNRAIFVARISQLRNYMYWQSSTHKALYSLYFFIVTLSAGKSVTGYTSCAHNDDEVRCLPLPANQLQEWQPCTQHKKISDIQRTESIAGITLLHNIILGPLYSVLAGESLR
jgi:hypothetical protein